MNLTKANANLANQNPAGFSNKVKERRKAIAHLEELSEELQLCKGENPKDQRNRLEERAKKVEQYLDELNKKLKRLEKTHSNQSIERVTFLSSQSLLTAGFHHEIKNLSIQS